MEFVSARSRVLRACVVLTFAGCGRSSTEPAASSATSSLPFTNSLAPPAATAPGLTKASANGTRAVVGSPAPDFTLKDIDGHAVHLADYRGKIVVLEWFNPGCPFVKASHTKGSLKGTAARHVANGVVWLAVVSSAPGKQGYEVDAIRDGAKRFGMAHPVLRDEDGGVGHAYGATNTPHLFVIDSKGVLAYGGAVDNSPDGEGDSPQGGSLVSYVDAAIDDVIAQHPVRTPSTKAYGCSVKYASP